MATATLPRPAAKRSVPDQMNFIENKFVPSASGKTFATLNPTTGEELCRVPESDASDVDRAVKAARRALDSAAWKKMNAADRGGLLFKLAELVEKNAQELAELESLNCGKI